LAIKCDLYDVKNLAKAIELGIWGVWTSVTMELEARLVSYAKNRLSSSYVAEEALSGVLYHKDTNTNGRGGVV